MRIDLGNCLAAEASPGVGRDELDRLDEHVAAAHDRIETGRAAGEFGYAALELPTRTDPDAIRAAIEPLRDAAAVLTVGIGGSALGARTLSAALGPDDPPHYALDNVDPVHATALLEELPLAETALHVVSRSGTTAETLANFLVVRDAMAEAGVEWTDRTLVTTGEAGPLRRLADRHDLPTLDVPRGVPGRFSALSPVGLVPAAIQGRDIDAVLAGAAEAAAGLTGSLFECPAYAYGAVTDALERRGATVNAVMPYAEALEPFAEWFAQLWAESLGKDGLGQVPARALGVTDQHSQLQLYRAGRPGTMVTFVSVEDGPDRAVPAPDATELEYLGGSTLRELRRTERRATEASLAAAGRPNVRIELDRLAPEPVGALLYSLEAACVMAAELKGIDAFDQPAVEWGKDATRGLLRGEETPETRAVTEKTTFLVE